jgi:hypothetical protein
MASVMRNEQVDARLHPFIDQNARRIEAAMSGETEEILPLMKA